MKKNIHPLERVLRFILGGILISLAVIGPANRWFLLGIIPFITGLVGWCPAYQLFGISTCDFGKKKLSLE
jgi:hypothetical protein